MKPSKLLLLMSAAAALAACDRAPTTVIAVPAPTPGVVPGPPGPQGATGNTGSTGSAGKTGESTTVIVVPPAASAPK